MPLSVFYFSTHETAPASHLHSLFYSRALRCAEAMSLAWLVQK